jgi:transposase
VLEHNFQLSKKNEIKRLKCGSLPAKADPAEQPTFYENTLLPLIKKKKKEKITLLFVDASHFIMGCDYLGYIYGKVRRFIRTFSGRSRYNVLGALNYVSKKMTTITNDAYITATEVCELIKKVSVEYAGKPIFLVLDNARYQKCKAVQALVTELKVTLVYIPPYSPNLNLIERLWKHTKSRLRTKYYDDFTVFKETIDFITGSTDKDDKAIIDRLIGEKVQLFDDKVFDNVVDFPAINKTSK